MPQWLNRILLGILGTLIVGLMGFLGFTIVMVWQHEYLLWKIMATLAILQQRFAFAVGEI